MWVTAMDPAKDEFINPKHDGRVHARGVINEPKSGDVSAVDDLNCQPKRFDQNPL